jgi:hypothetical protein
MTFDESGTGVQTLGFQAEVGLRQPDLGPLHYCNNGTLWDFVSQRSLVIPTYN